jgi:hypothetical protein
MRQSKKARVLASDRANFCSECIVGTGTRTGTSQEASMRGGGILGINAVFAVG